jgi:hypothetical protein
MIDLHLIHGIANGVKYYQENQDEFRAIFDDISQTYSDKLYAKIQNLDIKYDSAYSNTHDSYPLITTSLAESTTDADQMLGNQGYNEKKVLFLNQECIVSLYTSDKDVLRALHRMIQSAFLIFKQSFLKSGYLNVEFISSTELRPDEDIIGKGVSVFGREITYLAQKQLHAKPILPADQSFPWVVSPISVNN